MNHFQRNKEPFFTVVSYTRQTSPKHKYLIDEDYMITLRHSKGFEMRKLFTANNILNLMRTRGVQTERLTEEDISNIVIRFIFPVYEWKGKPNSHKDYFFPDSSDIKNDKVIKEILQRTQIIGR